MHSTFLEFYLLELLQPFIGKLSLLQIFFYFCTLNCISFSCNSNYLNPHVQHKIYVQQSFFLPFMIAVPGLRTYFFTLRGFNIITLCDLFYVDGAKIDLSTSTKFKFLVQRITLEFQVLSRLKTSIASEQRTEIGFLYWFRDLFSDKNDIQRNFQFSYMGCISHSNNDRLLEFLFFLYFQCTTGR